MDNRHSSPPSRARSPRPSTQRKRSNSFPISDALGCSTPEAELILAEGRAALRSRLADRQRGRSRRDYIQTFNPKDHIGHLVQHPVVSEATDRDALSPPGSKPARHARIPSDATDRSTSTIVAPNQPSLQESSSNPTLTTGPIGDYSAQLAKFIQSQLNSIPTYTPGETSISPRSCPDLSFVRSPSLRSPALSPAKPVPMKRHVGAPSLIEIPSIRPPARSAFSAWSSTDDEADDEAPPLPDTADIQEAPKASYTPSVLRYYEQTNDATFLFSSTPMGDDAKDKPSTAKAFSFPANPAPLETRAEPSSTRDEDYPSSDLSRVSPPFIIVGSFFIFYLNWILLRTQDASLPGTGFEGSHHSRGDPSTSQSHTGNITIRRGRPGQCARHSGPIPAERPCRRYVFRHGPRLHRAQRQR
ncbi:uncharacterized protein N0V89_004210 [Didymosphaeria variabile]|uniref:Uncharacterized protein n=1 Tax=Didymosphaeria variabile TaxID=1932322 RepID=A0A9W8XS21_9PLEO|nr:uncharacterized protein N0V89_004210 [Didymosphaeria variabile]KAJ4356180.1 hypothetical protein N0V89_004210 [Didymosphaeria variabile]